jgi:hypothetical protein
MVSMLASAQDVDVVVENKQVEKTMGGCLSTKVVHSVCITAQATKDVFGCIAGDGHSPASSQGYPLLPRTREPLERMATAFQAVEEGQQPRSVISQESPHLADMGIFNSGCHANELIQARRSKRQGGRPQQAGQQTLETQRPLPMSSRLVTSGNQCHTMSLNVRRRPYLFLVKLVQSFDRLLVNTFGLSDGCTDVETVDMKPAELVNGLGQIGFDRLQIAFVHVCHLIFDQTEAISIRD